MVLKLYIVIQLQNIFLINKTRLKYQFPWQQTSTNNEIYKMLFVIDFGGI